MRTWTGLATVGLSMVLAGSATARDLFVNNIGGDDRWLGFQVAATTDVSGPVRTIGRALELAQASDRIVLAKTAQPYRESLSLVGSRHSGLADHYFVIEGSGATLDGTMPLSLEGWEHYRGNVFRFTPRTQSYQGLFLNDRPLLQVPVARGAAAAPDLKPLEWCQFNGRIYFCVEQDKLARDYALTCAEKQTGITLYHVEHVAIMNLTVQGFRVDGIQAANSARNIRLLGLKVRGNAHTGITVGGASLVDLEGSLVGNNTHAQLLTLPLSETHVRTSDLLPLTAPAWVDQGGRVFLEGKLVQGGLEKILANPSQEEKK